MRILSRMDAEPVLRLVANALAKHRLEAVLIGNAAAALQGSPVTTVDLDFMFRKTPTNIRKLKAIADDLGAVVMRPFYPVSELYRVIRERDSLQLDFMVKVDGIRSFERLRASATMMNFGDRPIAVASLSDIIKSKKAAGFSRDLAVLSVLEETLIPMRSPNRRTKRVSALRKESDRTRREQILRLLALPPEKRTNFLRVRIPFKGSAI